MRWVLGIGNPGQRYAGTRHNIGFSIVDEVARRNEVVFRKASSLAMVADCRAGWLVKPLSYVNRSGKALESLLVDCTGENIEILVVVDDVNLDLGRLRGRAKGSDGGHKGLQDLARAWESNNFPRLRIGIGRNQGLDLKEHVLVFLMRRRRKLWTKRCIRLPRPSRLFSMGLRWLNSAVDLRTDELIAAQ